MHDEASDKIHKKYDDNNYYSDDDDAKKRNTNTNTIGANTIQHHRGQWKTCKITSLKIPVSACHM